MDVEYFKNYDNCLESCLIDSDLTHQEKMNVYMVL